MLNYCSENYWRFTLICNSCHQNGKNTHWCEYAFKVFIIAYFVSVWQGSLADISWQFWWVVTFSVDINIDLWTRITCWSHEQCSCLASVIQCCCSCSFGILFHLSFAQSEALRKTLKTFYLLNFIMSPFSDLLDFSYFISLRICQWSGSCCKLFMIAAGIGVF